MPPGPVRARRAQETSTMSRKHPAVRPLGIGVCLLTAAATALPLSTASAALPATPVLPALGDTVDALTKTLDTRVVKDAVVPTSAARTAASALLARAGAGARATWDERFGTLRSVRTDGYLSPTASGSAVDVARTWLRGNAAAFGLTSAQVDSLAVVRDHTLPTTGTHVVDFVQTTDGVAAARG